MKDAAALDIGLWSFWEHWASDPNGGAARGLIDANAAADLADAVNQPGAAPIYMPNDQVVSDWTATLAYFSMVATALRARKRTPGFYGQTSVFRAVQRYGYEWFVKAPDGTNDTGPANIVQSVAPHQDVNGVTCDVDEILTADFGGWNAAGLFTLDPPRKVPEMFVYKDPSSPALYLSTRPATYIPTPADHTALTAAGIPDVVVSPAFFKSLQAP